MSERVRSLYALVKSGAMHVLDAWLVIRRSEEANRNAADKLRGLAHDAARAKGGHRVFEHGGVQFWLVPTQEYLYDHNPEWVAAKNRIETIERSMREQLEEPTTGDARNAAKRGKLAEKLRVYLRSVPNTYKRSVK